MHQLISQIMQSRQSLIAGVALCLIGITGIFWVFMDYYASQPLQIVNVYPQDRVTGNKQPVIFTFNRRIDAKELEIQISPTVAGSLENISSKEVKFIPETPFLFETVHEFSFLHRSEDKLLYDLIGPKHSSSQDVLLHNDALVSLQYPLAYELPIKNDEMDIYYSDILELTVVLKRPDADYLAVLIPLFTSAGLVLDSHTILVE